MNQLNNEILSKRIKTEDAQRMAKEVVHDVFAQMDDPAFKDSVLQKLNNAYKSEEHNENFLFAAKNQKSDKTQKKSMFESILRTINLKAKMSKMDKNRLRTMTMESFTLSDDGNSSNNNPFTPASTSNPMWKTSPRNGVIKLQSERKQQFFKSASAKIKESDLGANERHEPALGLHALVSAPESIKHQRQESATSRGAHQGK